VGRQVFKDVVVEREVVRDGDVRERRAEDRLGTRFRQRTHLLRRSAEVQDALLLGWWCWYSGMEVKYGQVPAPEECRVLERRADIGSGEGFGGSPRRH
jgi:hypothetical protein